MDAFKEVAIGEYRFKIGRMSALTGTRILSQMMAAVLKSIDTSGAAPEQSEEKPADAAAAQQEADSKVASLWLSASDSLDEVRYVSIQKNCLQLVSVFSGGEEAPAIPLLHASGKLIVKELEQDIKTISQLIVEVLQFNLSPFFIESASSSQAGAAARTNQPASQVSTLSY